MNRQIMRSDGDPAGGGGSLVPLTTTLGQMDLGELASDETIANFRDKPVSEALKALSETKRLVGGMVKLPGEDSTPEERAKFFERLGRPESPDGYELKANLPEGMKVSSQLEKWYRQAAHEAGVPKDAASKLFSGFNEQIVAMISAEDAKTEEVRKSADKELRTEWGDFWAERCAVATRYAKTLDEGFAETLAAHGLLDPDNPTQSHPTVVRYLYANGERIGNDSMIGVGNLPTPATAPQAGGQQQPGQGGQQPQTPPGLPSLPFDYSGSMGHLRNQQG